MKMIIQYAPYALAFFTGVLVGLVFMLVMDWRERRG
jgi:uncharacterized protein involved in exopolysaccharide biosynthesis